MADTSRRVFLGALTLTALVLALVLITEGKHRSPVPAGSGSVSHMDCASQLGVRAVQRAYRLCLYSHPLGESQVGQAPRSQRLHWSVAVADVSVVGG